METTNLIFTEAFFYIAPIIASLTTAIAGIINGLCKVEKNWAKQGIAWIVAALLSVGTVLLKMLGTPSVGLVIALAVVSGLSSNGLYDISAIKQLVNSIGKNKNKENE